MTLSLVSISAAIEDSSPVGVIKSNEAIEMTVTAINVVVKFRGALIPINNAEVLIACGENHSITRITGTAGGLEHLLETTLTKASQKQ